MSNENLAAEAVTSMVLALAAEAADHGKTVSAQSVLRDLGLDCLGAVELVMAVEAEFGVDLDGAFGDEDDPETFLPLPVQALVDATLEAMKRRAQDLGAASAVAALCEAAGVDLSGVDLGAAVPKLTPADIEAVIVAEQYFTAEHGINGALVRGELYGGVKSAEWMGSLAHVTFCVLLLRNGTKVTGVNHGPVSAANFDAAIGRQYARANAVEKVWELEGYLLRERLSAPALTLNLSESQQAELLEQIRNAPPGTLMMQATDGGPNPSYSPEHDAAFAALGLVRAFVAKHRISCPETIHQTDRVIEDAYGFIQDLADAAGYHREPGDADGEEVQP